MTTLKIKTSDLRKLAADLRREEQALLSYANFTYRNAVMQVFERVVKQTPQFSGFLVSNWYLGIGSGTGEVDTSKLNIYSDAFGNDGASQMGDSANFDEALARARSTSLGLRYLSKVDAVIYNTVPYADDVDEGIGPEGADGTPKNIRAVNLIDGVVQMLALNVTWAKSTGTWRE